MYINTGIKTTGAFTTEKCWDQMRATSAKQEMQFVLLITEHVLIYFNAMKNIRYVLKPEQFPQVSKSVTLLHESNFLGQLKDMHAC